MTSASHVPSDLLATIDEIGQEVRELRALVRNPVALAVTLAELLREQGLDRIVERPA